MPIGAKTTGIVQCLCYAVGGILLECFGWKGYCKVLLSDHFFPLMNYFYTDGSGLFQDDPAPIHRTRGLTLNNLMSMTVI